MTTIKISASCPYEIGEEITINRKIFPPELAFKFPAETHTITDIASTARRPGKPCFCMSWTGAVRWCRYRSRGASNHYPPSGTNKTRRFDR